MGFLITFLMFIWLFTTAIILAVSILEDEYRFLIESIVSLGLWFATIITFIYPR